MRTVKERTAKKELDAKGKEWEWMWEHPLIKSVDWRDSPEEVLKEVDEQLAKHGLEVVQINNEDDQYAWYIAKKAKK